MATFPLLVGQDGQALSAEQAKSLRVALAEIQQAVGPLDDLYLLTQLTIIHTGDRSTLGIDEPEADRQVGRSEWTGRIYVGGAAYGPRECGLAHEIGHWLTHVWIEACGRYRPRSIWRRPGLQQLLIDAQDLQDDAEVLPDDGPAEVWARLFETLVAWELDQREPGIVPIACPDWLSLTSGFETDRGPMHFSGYDFVTDWDFFVHRTRRWVKRLLREIRASP